MTEAADPDLIAEVSRFFSRRSDHSVVAVSEDLDVNLELWRETEDLGLPLVGVAEEAGGSGGSLLDALAVLRLAGANAVPLPLAQTHLAGWLLAGSGLEVPPGPLAFAEGTTSEPLRLDGPSVRGTVAGVDWARIAGTIVGFAESGGDPIVVAMDPATCAIVHGVDLAGQPRDTVTFEGPPVSWRPAAVTPREMELRSALVRAAQIAGALDAVAALTRTYVNDRVQFGKPIGTFQAVQQHVVILAQAAAMTGLSLDRAAMAACRGDASFEISALKLIANQNATAAVRAAHQAHGAIGLTQEYRLQQFTRRLNSWRLESGTDDELALRLGRAVSRAESFTAVITSTDPTMEV